MDRVIIRQPQRWKSSGFLSFWDIAVTQVNSFIKSCQYIYVLIERRQNEPTAVKVAKK